MDFFVFPATERMVGNDLCQNIRHMLAHGADVQTKDLYGRGCLHTLISNSYFHCSTSQTEKQMLTEALSLLIRQGADIYAVDNDGFSVTEWAHFGRRGYYWEAALENSALEVEQVYLKDHNNRSKVSDDIYAPDEAHPRQRGCDKDYLTWDEELERMGAGIIGVNSPVDKEEPSDSKIRPIDEEEDDFGANDGDRDEDSYQDECDGSELHSDSDEEMGGVPVTGKGSL